MSRLLVLIATLALLSGCGDASTSGGGGSAGDTGSVDLQGSYVASSVEASTRDLVEGTTVTLTFEGGRVTMNAGCNAMSGPASVEDGKLVVKDLAGTEMGCETRLMDQDAWLGDFLSSSPALDADGDGFTLSSDEATLTFSKQAAPSDASLARTTWTLESVLTGSGGDGAASSVPQGARKPSIVFQNGVAGWDASFSTGCNSGRGPVRIGSEVMDFGDLVTTKMACPGAVGELEKTFLGVLGRGTTYAVEGDRLTLTAADGRSGLVFRAG